MDPEILAAAWADRLEPDDLPVVLRSLSIFVKLGQWTPGEADAWRRAILDRHGLPVGRGQA